MSQEFIEDEQQEYQIVIVQCCENCQTHQSFSRHSEWKYFQQFNQLKKKIERFVPNTIVIKNPVPDELSKPTDVKLDKNTYVNKNNSQKVIFPRIGAFEIYIYNVLIYSKLMSNSWPNHYKILQILNQIIQSKKNGLSLQQYSVYNIQQPKVQKIQKGQKLASNSPKNSPQKKQARIVSKKKKSITGNQFRVYKSKDKSTIQPKQRLSHQEQQKIIQSKKLNNLQPIYFSQSTRTKKIPNTLLNVNQSPKRNIQSKNQHRVKLPSLRNSINFQQDYHQQQFKKQQQPFKAIKKISQQKSSQQSSSLLVHQKSLSDEKSFNKIFNSIQEFQNEQMSIIQRKASLIEEQNKFDSLLLNQNQSSQIKVSINDQDNQMIDLQQQMRFLENRSVQYSQRQYGKDFMNRSIQYYEEEGYHTDFAIQIDDLSMPKQINYQFVQTDFLQPIGKKQEKLPQKKPKPYMLDQSVQANIILKKKEKSEQVQTLVTPVQEKQINTQILAYVNRGYQFPQQQEKKVQGIKIDPSFQHLYQKRRNIMDNQWYSIDRFQQKATKYKWVGKGNPQLTHDQIKMRMYVECLVFSVYNYFGIKTPQKRLSYQQCSNVVADKAKSSIYHMMTFDNPQIQYPFQFQELNFQQKKYPISQLLTFKTSKQSIKFSNWGSFLAIAYFLKDTQIFNEKSKIGLVITNQQVKQIHKLSAFDYTIFHEDLKFKNKDQILVNSSQQNYIKIDRLSKQTQLEFIAMLSKITDQHFFSEMMKNIEQIFVHKSSAHKNFQNTLNSLALQEVKTASIMQAFINKLKFQYDSIKEFFKGRIYTYRTYHSLQANVKFQMSITPYIQRKMKYQQKKVAKSDVLKHIRNKDNIVFLYGQQGSGKSTLLKLLSEQIKKVDRYNVVTILNPQKQLKNAITQLEQSVKNIILIDDIQTSIEETLKFLVKAAQKYNQHDLSFCLATTSQRIVDNFKVRFTKMKVVRIDVEPLDNQQIRNYMTNAIHKKHFTQRKQIVDIAIENIGKIQIIRNIFYLNLYCRLITDLKSVEDYKIPVKNLTKYDVLKQTFAKCIEHHRNQLRQMVVEVKQPMKDLRRMALQQFHGVDQASDLIIDTIATYEQDSLLRNQLQFYPLNLNHQINSLPLFIHSEFHKFLIVQAYSFFVQKGYRNMKMSMLYQNQSLMQLIQQKYVADQNYQNLLQVIYESSTYPNTHQQASNAMTLLCQMGYLFSNLNFDNCQLPQADLNSAIFYSCTFRNSNMNKVVLYKTQMINCQVDNVVMDNINLYMKKYEIEFTALTCSLSIDGRTIALGCGNYLIILNASTGKQIKKIQAHLDIIRTVRYSKDGNSLITIADDKTLRIWDIITYRSVVFKLPQKGSINFSNETETIASVSKKQLKVWNIKSMANQAICQGHSDLITTVNFSTDGQSIVTGSRDCTLRLWNLKAQQKHIYKGHDNQILVGKFSPNNRTIISSSKKKDIIIWQTQTQTKIVQKQFNNQVIEICPDNKEHYVIITFSHDSDIVVLNFNNLEVVHNLKGHKNRVLSINFDSGFKQLISLSKDRNVRLWDISQILRIQEKIMKKNSFKIHKGPVFSIAYDKANKRYATGHLNGQINIWSSEDNKLIDQVCDHLGAVKCLSYDKSGKLYSGGADGILRIWTLPANRQPRKLELYSVQMLTLKLSEKNRIMVTSSANDEFVIYDFTGIKLLMSTRQQGKIYSVAFSKDQKYMAAGGSQKCIVMYEIHNNGSTISRMQEYEQHTDAINCLAFQGDSLLICALKNGHIFIWNYLRGNLIKKIQNISPIKSLLIFQKKYACFSSEDGKIRVINMDQGKQVKVFRYSDITNAMITNEDQSLVYVGGNEGNVVKWNLNSVKPLTSKLKFPRKAIDEDCTKTISIQSSKCLKIQSLFEHKEQIVEVNCPYDIQGVNFHEGKVILLLKNQIYWQLGKKQFQFNSQKRQEGDLSFIRDRFTNFYRTGVKKIKGISKPTQTIVQQLSIG